MKRTFARRTPAGWVESEVSAFEECDNPECHEPYAFQVFLLSGATHPAARAWRGRLVCWHHAKVARLVSERYELGLQVSRVRGDDGSPAGDLSGAGLQTDSSVL